MLNRTDGEPIAVTPDPSGYGPRTLTLWSGSRGHPPPHGHIETR